MKNLFYILLTIIFFSACSKQSQSAFTKSANAVDSTKKSVTNFSHFDTSYYYGITILDVQYTNNGLDTSYLDTVKKIQLSKDSIILIMKIYDVNVGNIWSLADKYTQLIDTFQFDKSGIYNADEHKVYFKYIFYSSDSISYKHIFQDWGGICGDPNTQSFYGKRIK